MIYTNGVTLAFFAKLGGFLAELTWDDGSWVADLQGLLLSSHTQHL